MKAIQCILNKGYMITDEGDVVCYFSDGESKISFTIPISDQSEIQQTLKVTEQIIFDSVHMTKSQFVVKYGDKFSSSSKLTTIQYYNALRAFIVDEKVAVGKGTKKSNNTSTTVSAAIVEVDQKLTRKQQVMQLLDQQITSPSQIAELLQTNAGYVSRLIKQIHEDSN